MSIAPAVVADVEVPIETPEQPKQEVSKVESPAPKPKAKFVDTPTKVKTDITNEKAFYFEYKSEEDEKVYSGQFICRRLNLGAIGKMGVMKSRLNGGEQVGPSIDFLHEMMSYCAVALVEFPDWWQPEEFFDALLLRQVYDYVRQWETTFRAGVAERR